MGLVSPYLEGGEATGYLTLMNKTKWEGHFGWGCKHSWPPLLPAALQSWGSLVTPASPFRVTAQAIPFL